MILNIRNSSIFTNEPAVRFAKEYGLPTGVWSEIWRRYKLLDYTNTEIKDYVFIKYGRNLTYPAVGRWIKRGEVYLITKPLIAKGVVHVNSVIFKEYEEYVMNELVRPLKDGATKKSKSII